MCFYLKIWHPYLRLSVCVSLGPHHREARILFSGLEPLHSSPSALCGFQQLGLHPYYKAVCRAVEGWGSSLKGWAAQAVQVGLPQTQICLCLSPACRALTHLCPTASCGTPSPTDWIESTRCSATSLLLRQSKCQCHSL